MSHTAVTAPELAPPVGQAGEVGGFLYLSGQVGQDPATGKVVAGGIVAETERVFQNLAAVLKAAGRSFADVACARVFLTNLGDYVAMNGVYAKHFRPPFPARTAIGGAALPLGACVEIDLVVKACGEKKRNEIERAAPGGHGSGCNRRGGAECSCRHSGGSANGHSSRLRRVD